MENNYYQELITRYLDNSATEEDAEILLSWLKDKKENMDLFVTLRDIWTKTSLLPKNDTDTEFALQRFKYRLPQDTPVNNSISIWPKLWNIAAILIIIILSGVLTVKFSNERRQKSFVVYNETVIPAGQKGKVTLTDGTKIVLNSGSKLRYPSNFNQNTREVYLQGEAYFEVAHNKSKPFLVHSGKMTVRVLGTSFNLKSYPGEDKIETTLVSGLVEIFETSKNKNSVVSTLRPNEQAIYDKTSGKVSIKKFGSQGLVQENTQVVQQSANQVKVLKVSPLVESIIQWKDQKLIFENETLEQMAQKLTRWYGKNVHIESEGLRSNRYSGKFIYNETIYQVLEVLSLTTDLKYYEKDHEIYIQSKN